MLVRKPHNGVVDKLALSGGSINIAGRGKCWNPLKLIYHNIVREGKCDGLKNMRCAFLARVMMSDVIQHGMGNQQDTCSCSMDPQRLSTLAVYSSLMLSAVNV